MAAKPAKAMLPNGANHATVARATSMLLLTRPQPPPLLAASFPANPERALRPGGQGWSRAAVARPAAFVTAASLRPGQKRKQVASVANPLVKHCVKLRLSAAHRRSCRRLLLVGLAPILEMCRFDASAIDCLLLLDGIEVPAELQEFSGNVVHISAAVMKKVSGMQSVDSTEAVAIMHMPKRFRDIGNHEGGADLDGLFHSPKRILVLDGIQDPGNLGTLIRSACAFNWDGAFLLPTCCDPFNEKALRAARGASLQLPIGSVLGSEGNGLSAETLQTCELVNIPMEDSTCWEVQAGHQSWTIMFHCKSGKSI